MGCTRVLETELGALMFFDSHGKSPVVGIFAPSSWAKVVRKEARGDLRG